MRTNLQRFREDADQRLRVLEAAVAEAEKGTSPEAAESVRRIARSVGHSAGDLGLGEIRRLAEDVVTAPDPARLVACARALLAETSGQPLASGAAAVRILAVEDDPVSARLLESMIGGEGREVVVVDTATEAQRLVEERSFDLLLLDLVLPDADGRDFLVTLRHRSDTADLPVIVCSALPALRAEPECLALGAHAYLEKPLQRDLTRSTVSRLLQEEAEPPGVSASWPPWVVNLAELSEAYGPGGGESGGFGHPVCLASIEIDGSREGAQAEEGTSVARHEMLGRVRDRVSSRAVVAVDRAGRVYALLPGVTLGAAAEGLREPFPTDPGHNAAPGLWAGVVDVSERPPLREAMARADRLLHYARSAGPAGSVWSEQEQARADHRILFVEDDRVTARLVKHRLSREGFEVLHYDHGQAAFEAAERERVALAIFDVKLPGMDGFELLEAVRRLSHFAEVPVIMLTSMGREPDVVRGFELGADDYVLKPFSPVELLARIHRLLEGRSHDGGP